MAEFIGFGASIIQMAGAGIALSTTLYNFVGSVDRPTSDIANIADNVRHTASALASVGEVFEKNHGLSVLSGKAMKDVNSLVARCKTVFDEIQHIVDKRRVIGKDDKSGLISLGKFAWPLKEQRVELLTRQLENLKDELILMVHILHLANGQANSVLEKDQEREKIRELHQHQQESLKALQSLESKLGTVPSLDGEASRAPNTPSRVPTIDFLVNTPAPSQPMSVTKNQSWSARSISTSGPLSDDLETSGSENTISDDEDEHLTSKELAQYATHIQKFLKHIDVLQDTFKGPTERTSGRIPKQRVHKIYRRFCRKFESEMQNIRRDAGAPAAPFPGFQPSKVQYPSQTQYPAISPRTAGVASTPQTGNTLSYDGTWSYTFTPNEDHQRTEYNQNVARPVENPHSEFPHTAHYTALRANSFPEIPGQLTRNNVVIASAVHKANVQSEETSGEGSKEGSQGGTDRDIEPKARGSVGVHFTKTGRVSKAKKGLKVHACSECGKSFTRAEHLRRHQKNHGPDQVSCHLCGKVFFRVDLLMRHIERHKDGPIVNTPDDQHPASPTSPQNGDNPSHDAPGSIARPGDYVWNEAEKKYEVHYVHYANDNLPPGTQPNSRRESVSHSGFRFSGPLEGTSVNLGSDSYNNPPGTTEPSQYETAWQNPAKRRRTEGNLFQSLHSPIHSPPSPWMKESMTLPPIRLGQNHDDSRSEVIAGAYPMLATPERTWTHINSSPDARLKRAWGDRINSGREASRSMSLQGTAPASPQNRTLESISKGRSLSSTESAWAKFRPSSNASKYSLANRTLVFPHSQPTSPTIGSVLRTYPNPFRPREPRQDNSAGHFYNPQGLPSPARITNTAVGLGNGQFRITNYDLQSRPKAPIIENDRGTHSRDRSSVSPGRVLEGGMQHANTTEGGQYTTERNKEEGRPDGQRSGIERDNKWDIRNERRSTTDLGTSNVYARRSVIAAGQDAPVDGEGNKDIVDVLLAQWTTVPVY